MASDDAIGLGDARVLKETDKALLVELEDGDEIWIPKSCVHDDSEVYKKGDEGPILVKSWWAEKQGLV